MKVSSGLSSRCSEITLPFHVFQVPYCQVSITAKAQYGLVCTKQKCPELTFETAKWDIWDSLVDCSSRLGRRYWRHDSRTSHVGLVEWRGHWWCLTEDSDNVITKIWAYTCQTGTEVPCRADSGRLWQQLLTGSVRTCTTNEVYDARNMSKCKSSKIGLESDLSPSPGLGSYNCLQR